MQNTKVFLKNVLYNNYYKTIFRYQTTGVNKNQ